MEVYVLCIIYTKVSLRTSLVSFLLYAGSAKGFHYDDMTKAKFAPRSHQRDIKVRYV